MSHQVESGTPRSAAAGPGPAGLAEQAASVPQVPGTPVQYPPPYHGRPVSWVAVSLVTAGFLAGGLALDFAPTWAGFWIGVGPAGGGGVLALATHIFLDWH